MGRLVRKLNGQVVVAAHRVAAPAYTLYVQDYSGGATPPDGWVYLPGDADEDDFARPWLPPQDALAQGVMYMLGDIVEHQGTRWRSLINHNVWEPGVSGWRDADTDLPTWIQPTGAHDAYAEGAVVRHQGKIWKSLTAANVWEPGVSGWREFAMIAPDGTPSYPDWVQPTGAHDAYAVGAIVRHNSTLWISTVNTNVWEPGVFGWDPYTP